MNIRKAMQPARKACGLCCTRIEKFSVRYGDFVALRDVNLHIHCGNLTAVIGTNGSGKSTLLKAILGEVRHEGSLKFLDNKSMHTDAPLVGYVPQKLNFDAGSPVSVMDLFTASSASAPVWGFLGRKTKIDAVEALSRVKAEHLVNHRLGELSGGELQRVLLALAIHPVPDLLLLDEPVSGVDQKGMSLFYGLVSELRKDYDLSIILVSHDLDLVADYADRVVLLNKTIEASGTPYDVFNHPKFREIFGETWFETLSKKTKKNSPGAEA